MSTERLHRHTDFDSASSTPIIERIDAKDNVVSQFRLISRMVHAFHEPIRTCFMAVNKNRAETTGRSRGEDRLVPLVRHHDVPTPQI